MQARQHENGGKHQLRGYLQVSRIERLMFDTVLDLRHVPPADRVYFLTEYRCARGGCGKECAGVEVIRPGGDEDRD
jgi:hypothetical protein